MCFGVEATAKTQELIDRASGHVLLGKDVSETDQYGRLLRYVCLVHPDGQRMLNEELIKCGYAHVSTYPPDVKYQEQFLTAQQQAGSPALVCGGRAGRLVRPRSASIRHHHRRRMPVRPAVHR